MRTQIKIKVKVMKLKVIHNIRYNFNVKEASKQTKKAY